jgi:hypothetical protein
MSGWLYDGKTAVRRPIGLSPDRHGWLITFTDTGERLTIDPASLEHVESRSDAEIYGRIGFPGWRLGLDHPVDAPLLAALPRRKVYGRWIDRLGLWRALLIGGAVSAIFLYGVHRLPDILAPVVPFSWEKRFGDALVGDLGGSVCTREEGQKALDTLNRRLATNPGKYQLRVIDAGLVNAAALPGGHIVLFRGLLDEAEGPDEIAGILGHEIAHVENRDVTRALIRQYGFSLLIASVGGTTGGNIDALLSAGHSREAESRADGDAIAALRRARVSPLATARFFEKLGKEEERLGPLTPALGYLSTHPLSADRKRRFAAAALDQDNARPSLTREEWRALKAICHTPEKQQKAKGA